MRQVSLKAEKIAPDLRFIVAPASKKIYIDAMRDGTLEILVEAGAAVVTPGCGPAWAPTTVCLRTVRM